MGPLEAARVRRLHVAVPVGAGLPHLGCRACGKDWPCACRLAADREYPAMAAVEDRHRPRWTVPVTGLAGALARWAAR